MGTMDWLRRNWPDLLIGVALIAVIAGIIATLISGGSFFPVGQGSRTNAPAATQSSGATPGTPAGSSVTTQEPADAGSNVGGAVATSPDDAAGSTPAAAPGDASSSGAAPTDAAGAAASTPAGGAIAVLPPSDGGSASTNPGASGAAAPAASTPDASTPDASTPAASTPAASGASATPPAGISTLSASASTDEPSYRVSVGAFGSMENAARLAEQFRAAGYPVLMGSQGNLNIVLVGPYATEAEARGVADRIRSGDFGVPDPTVYLFEPEEASDAAQAAPAATPAAPAVSSATPAATPTVGGRYLQVGAYGSRESSLPQRERLEGLGFAVTERVENDLVKLLVGPFDDAALSDAQARLEAAGIESFAR